METVRKLDVAIEVNGRMREVGSITGENEYTASFAYSEDYLASPDARAISLSLPLRSEPYGPLETGNFFEGLLPEGFLRRTISTNNRADSNDYLTLLEMLGCECLGAIQIRGGSFVAVEPGYRELSSQELMDLASEGATASADLVVEAHLSLTGASGKVGVYRSDDGRWYLPIGSAPSTHILKQSHIRYDYIVQNERLAMRTAEILGLDVPETIIVDTGNGEDDGSLLFASERYDRVLEGSVNEISGLPVPRRLHQEDFGQALGISAADKYERSGGAYMKRMFELLDRSSKNPVEDQMKLWDIIVFHYLIGNTDGHVKNFSLLYDSRLRSVSMAPAYDIISTVVYDNHSSQMAFSIGGEMDWKHVDRDCFARAADEAGLNRKIMLGRFDDLSGRFDAALARASSELADTGYTEVTAIADIIKQMKR